MRVFTNLCSKFKLNPLKTLKTKMAPIISTSDVDAVAIAIETLKNGGVIAIPTDTVYGLACAATNVQSISKLYEIKSRNENKPVAICVGRQHDVAKWANCSNLPPRLLEALLPGPVTLIVECINALDKSLVFDGKLGVRIPDYRFIQDVAKGLDSPIALTSANLSGQGSTVNVYEFKELWACLDCVFDGGDLGENKRNASTVIDLSEKGCYKIVRNGIAFDKSVSILNGFGLRNI